MNSSMSALESTVYNLSTKSLHFQGSPGICQFFFYPAADNKIANSEISPGTPEISLVDSKVLMPVDNVPNIESGCAAGCDFYFEIEHKPATKIYKRIKSFKDALPLSILVRMSLCSL